MEPVWETCKENIEPISQGRKIETLVASLTIDPATNERNALIAERKAKFHDEIKSLEGGDLSKELDLWCEFIDWLEQNLTDGGRLNEISSVIEKCIERFYDKKEFKQDKRIFNIFMKFRRFCDEPGEIFHFMYANALCTLHADLYLKWSWQCEVSRNFKRAEDLLKLGIKNLASPREILEEAHEELKRRINVMISNGESLDPVVPPNSNSNSNVQARRSAQRTLQALKFTVSKSSGETKVPVNRIKGSLGSTGGLKSQAPSTRPNNQINGSRPQVPTRIFSEVDSRSAQFEEMGRKIPTTQKIGCLGRVGRENNN